MYPPAAIVTALDPLKRSGRFDPSTSDAPLLCNPTAAAPMVSGSSP